MGFNVEANDMIVDVDPFVAPDKPHDVDAVRLHLNAIGSSPPQIPFDDLAMGMEKLVLPAPQAENPSPVEVGISSRSSPVRGIHSPSPKPQPPSAPSSQQAQRSELFQATRSSPVLQNVTGHRPNLEDFTLHDESPFEAARRAQRVGQSAESLPKQTHPERKFIPGQVPSIRPGEIMPDYLIPLWHGPPTFAPPIDAPPFPPFLPPVVHPIRAAHFPPQHGELGSANSGFPPSPQPQSYSGSSSPYSQSSPSLPSLPHIQQRADMSRTPPPQSHQPPQLLRSPSHAQTLPNASNNQPPPLPQASRRHTYDPHRGPLGGAPPVSNRNYTPPPPVPQPPEGLQGPPVSSSQQPSRRASHYHPPPHPSPSSLEVPPPLTSRESFRQSLRPSPLRSEFAPVPTPIRLPSENIKTPANASSRSALKPIMPPLLAPLAQNKPERSALQRSVSSTGPEKGGFFSRTKSLLRKRSSASGVKLRTDGGISFAPPMHTLQEEDVKPGRRFLNKKK